jgi:hypothetical protein
MSQRILRHPLPPFSLARAYKPIISNARLHLNTHAALVPPSSARVATTRIPKASAISLPASLQHAFHTGAALQKDHHFDTLKFVQRLQAEGFSEEQSEALMRVLSDVIEER